MKTPQYRSGEPHRDAAGIEARFGLRVTAALSEQAHSAPMHDIDERLRVAREQALLRARAARQAQKAPQEAPSNVVVGRGGAAVLSGGGWGQRSPWFFRFAAVLPLLVLVAGLVRIDEWHDRAQIVATADVDTALLTDDLPPDAYSDPGFVEFLKAKHN